MEDKNGSKAAASQDVVADGAQRAIVDLLICENAYPLYDLTKFVKTVRDLDARFKAIEPLAGQEGYDRVSSALDEWDGFRNDVADALGLKADNHAPVPDADGKFHLGEGFDEYKRSFSAGKQVKVDAGEYYLLPRAEDSDEDDGPDAAPTAVVSAE